MKNFYRTVFCIAALLAFGLALITPAQAARASRPPTVIILDPGSPLSPP